MIYIKQCWDYIISVYDPAIGHVWEKLKAENISAVRRGEKHGVEQTDSQTIGSQTETNPSSAFWGRRSKSYGMLSFSLCLHIMILDEVNLDVDLMMPISHRCTSIYKKKHR